MSRTDNDSPLLPVCLLTRPAAGGIRSHVVQLLRHLSPSRYSITLAAPGELLSSLAGEKLPPYIGVEFEIGAHPSLGDVALALRLKALAAATPFGLVHAHGVRAGVVAALSKQFGARFPLGVTYHNVPSTSVVSRLALRFLASNAAAQIAVSDAIANRLPGSPLARVIPNGIDLDYFSGSNKRLSKRVVNTGNEVTTVGVVARLSWEKGVDILLEAARLTPTLHYLVAGTGSEAGRLRDTAPKNVEFLGYVKETRTVYEASDIVVIPSRSEGQGIVALEAMASGVPVIASNVGGLRETIISGSTGILVEPENSAALAEAILALSSELEVRTMLSKAAIDWVLANAEVHRRIAELEQVYSSIASPKT